MSGADRGASRTLRAVGRALGRALDRHWCPSLPAERLAAFRILAGGFALIYVLARLPYLLSHAHFDPQLFRPIGIVDVILPRPFLPVVVQLITAATALSAIPFVLGYRFRLTGPLFAVLLLWTLSYRSSWGMVFHTENLLVLHVLILGLARSADAWSLDARRTYAKPAPSRHYGWPLRLSCAVVAIAYVLAGIAKARNAGWDWVLGDELRNHIALDNARKALLGDIYSPLAAPLMHWDLPFRVLACVTLAIEFMAPLALWGQRLAGLWVMAALGFHLGVVVLMMIFFPYQVLGIAFACFFPLERWYGRVYAWYTRSRKETLAAIDHS